MNGSIRVSAKTVDDAITEAMIQLGVTSDRLEYEVIEKGSSGFLGIGMKQAVIEARRKPESEPEVVEKEPFAPVEEIREEKAEEIAEPVKAEVKEEAPVVEKQEERPAEEPKKARELAEVQPQTVEAVKTFLADTMKAMNMEVEIEISIDEDGALCADLRGEHMGILIGKRGQTLDSLQYLVSLIVNKGTEGYLRVKLDTENYRERRKETLETLAKNIAYKVKRTRRPVSLEPMNPYERRIIHAAVQNDKYVTTRSEGEEPFRHVVIALKKEAVSGERKGRYDRAGKGRSDRSYGYKGNNRRGGSYQTAPKAEPVTETVSESTQE